MKYNQFLCTKEGSLPPCLKLHSVKLESFTITSDNSHKTTLLKYFSHTRKGYTNFTQQKVQIFLVERFFTKTTLDLSYSQCVKVLLKLLTVHYLYETKKYFINAFNG